MRGPARVPHSVAAVRMILHVRKAGSEQSTSPGCAAEYSVATAFNVTILTTRRVDNSNGLPDTVARSQARKYHREHLVPLWRSLCVWGKKFWWDGNTADR